jgi:hypothetical protein
MLALIYVIVLKQADPGAPRRMDPTDPSAESRETHEAVSGSVTPSIRQVGCATHRAPAPSTFLHDPIHPLGLGPSGAVASFLALCKSMRKSLELVREREKDNTTEKENVRSREWGSCAPARPPTKTRAAVHTCLVHVPALRPPPPA